MRKKGLRKWFQILLSLAVVWGSLTPFAATVYAANSSPVIGTAGGTTAFTGTPIVVDNSITISDEDSATLASASVFFAGFFVSQEDVLSFTNTDPGLYGNIDGSYDVASGTMTLTSSDATATIGQWTAALRAVTYNDTCATPYMAARSILFVVHDGDSPSNLVTKQVSVTHENQAPSVTVPGSISVTEDTPTALTGISFADADAGSGNVTATFSVPSGTLSAASGAGVTVMGAGTGSLSLDGTLANLNAFVLASGVIYTPAANATSDAVLSVSIDDNGNTGGGGSRTASSTVTLILTAVNDAPVNIVPSTQTVDSDTNFYFSAANGNGVSISDVDVGGYAIPVKLSVNHGYLTLINKLGVSGITDGWNLYFTGTISCINSALEGMMYTPAAGYIGPDSLQITTNDWGHNGSGGTQIDTDTIPIIVQGPKVSYVTSTTPDGTYAPGATLSISVVFTKAVTVDTTGGTPTLLLETGATDRPAVYSSSSGTNVLNFSYTVQAGDTAADLDYASAAALSLNGATIKDASSKDADLTLPAPGSVDSLGWQRTLVIDGVAAKATALTLPADGTYRPGQPMVFTVTFDSVIAVNTTGGTPSLPISIGGSPREAAYVSGSGSNQLTFQYTMGAGDNGKLSIGNAILLNNGTLLKYSGMGIDPTLPAAPVSSVYADTLPPLVLGAQNAGNSLILTFSEPMNTALAGTVTSDGLILTNPLWSNGNQTLTYTVSGLAYDRTYALHIAGFSDAAGNAMGVTDCLSFTTGHAPAGNEYSLRTLTDADTGIFLSGSMESGVSLHVTRFTLGDDAASKAFELHLQNSNDQLLYAVDISLTSGYESPLTISLPVGQAYNGQTATLLHYTGAGVETLTSVVSDGKTSFTVNSLSPFALFVQKAGNVPKTGDSSPLQLWLSLNFAATAVLACLLLKPARLARRRKI